jgi:hypothetical protein
MPSPLLKLPVLFTLAAVGLLLWIGPIPQPPDYHAFADRSVLFGLPRAADVLSNAGFAAVGLWGWLRLRPMRHHPAIRAGWPGYRLFLAGLVLTALGSAFYHLSPDNQRLVWDRLPIALASVGLLAAVRAETRGTVHGARDAALLAVLAVLSVAWWHVTEQWGRGDLRPYLLLQLLPLVLVPLWQALYRSPPRDRAAFGLALFAYVLAKAAELLDHPIAAQLGWLSGHTLKHLLATLAAALVVGRLAWRIAEPGASSQLRRQPDTPIHSTEGGART